ncbi:MAG TPA: amino acid deaminase [Nakamurella sp.]|nr:amino acid deaminase [Nakamurella sp.]
MTADRSWLLPDDAPIDWRSKCFGPDQQGRTVADLVAAGTRVSQLPTPLLTLDAGAVEHNIAVMDAFLSEHGLHLAPHGKTTMAPQLWHRQLRAGAWAITVATPWQLRVAVANGVRRILHAGAMLSEPDLRYVGQLLDSDPDVTVLVWADSPEAVQLVADRYPAGSRPLPVLVDRGAPGARTGARTLAESLQTAEAVHRAPNLHLAGIAAWEGSLAGASGPGGREAIAAFCDGAAETFREAVRGGLLAPEDEPVITGGGSAYFDIVAERWAPLREWGARIVLRSGCYLTHDDGGYAASTPFGRRVGQALRPALHAWGQVVSRPEPGLALLNTGRRDVPYDGRLPLPQLVRGRDADGSARALAGASITALNDQHGYLQLDPGSDLRVGEVVRSGISHPCTAFDKWSMIPVLDDAAGPDPAVIGAVRTVF